jgi:hypothetical protein
VLGLFRAHGLYSQSYTGRRIPVCAGRVANSLHKYATSFDARQVPVEECKTSIAGKNILNLFYWYG